MILIIDNYDSFTWNLADLVRQGSKGEEVKVLRNDEISIEQIKGFAPRGILISPGPGRPMDSGVSVEVVKKLYQEVPILGICLGHQLIGEVFGGKIVHGMAPVHGKTSLILHDGKNIFQNMPHPFMAMRYHSLLIDSQNINPLIEVSAYTPEGEIMGIRHKIFNLAGVQFHPESILTESGGQIIRNWISSLTEKEKEKTLNGNQDKKRRRL